MAAPKLLVLLRTLTSGVQEVSTAIKDVKSVNRVLEKIGKDDSFTSQDPSLGFEIESFKHSLREAVIISSRFIVGSKNLAEYSSEIKESLAADDLQGLKLFLDDVAQQLSKCRMHMEEHQAECDKISDKARQLTERKCRSRVAHSNTDGFRALAIYGLTQQDTIGCLSNLTGVAAAFLFPGIIALMFREYGLFFLFIYACFGIGGFILGKQGTSTLLMRRWNSAYARRTQGVRQYNNEIQLQSVQDSIATFLREARESRSQLLQLEQRATEASGSVTLGAIIDQGRSPAHKFDEVNELKTQLSELQHKMNELLTYVAKEEQYWTP